MSEANHPTPDEEVCNRCSGEGVEFATNVATEKTTCFGCKGTGRMVKCSRCGGDGKAKTWAEAMSDWRCEDCGGSGQVRP